MQHLGYNSWTVCQSKCKLYNSIPHACVCWWHAHNTPVGCNAWEYIATQAQATHHTDLIPVFHLWYAHQTLWYATPTSFVCDDWTTWQSGWNCTKPTLVLCLSPMACNTGFHLSMMAGLHVNLHASYATPTFAPCAFSMACSPGYIICSTYWDKCADQSIVPFLFQVSLQLFTLHQSHQWWWAEHTLPSEYSGLYPFQLLAVPVFVCVCVPTWYNMGTVCCPKCP